MSEERQQLLAYIEFCFPESFPEIRDKNLISENLFSPFSLTLPQAILTQIEQFVEDVYQLKESSIYQDLLPLPESFKDWPLTLSILSCFDFHYTPESGLKLIEINTNASLYLPLILQRCAQGNHCLPPQFEYLAESFQKTFQLQPGDGVSILDAVPENEGLYFEFLIFKEWLKQKGFKSNIVSLETYKKESHKNIYNRYTDFYFGEDRSTDVHEDYFSKNKVFSPNPREYFLMADKKRLETMRQCLIKQNNPHAELIPETKLFGDFESKDEVWAHRKKYFFKPSQSFGSKGAFSGKSISRKAFENLYDPEFVAQELCPAGKRVFEKGGQSYEMKFDLRFFTFDGQVQNYGARLYQGQTTNMKTPNGGLSPILWSSVVTI